MEISRILPATTLALSVASVAHAQSTFPDVPDNHWAATAVKKLAELGIIEGFPAPPPRFNKVAKIKTPVAKTKAPVKVSAQAKSKSMVK